MSSKPVSKRRTLLQAVAVALPPLIAIACGGGGGGSSSVHVPQGKTAFRAAALSGYQALGATMSSQVNALNITAPSGSNRAIVKALYPQLFRSSGGFSFDVVEQL